MRSRPFSRVNVVCSSCLSPKSSPYFTCGREGGDKTPILSTAAFSSFANYANQHGSAPKSTPSNPPPQPLPPRIPTSTSSTPSKYGSLSGTDQNNFSPSQTHHHQPPALDKEQRPIGSVPSLRNSPSDLDGGGPGILPIALEPTDDGIAAVATVILELPRGTEGADDDDPRSCDRDAPPDRICLGSSLVMLRVLYPMLMSQAPGARSLLVPRRRPSHAAS